MLSARRSNFDQGILIFFQHRSQSCNWLGNTDRCVILFQLLLIDLKLCQQAFKVMAFFDFTARGDNPVSGMAHLLVERREIGIHGHIGITHTLMTNDQRQRQPVFVDVTGEDIQQHKELLIERRQVVLFTPCRVSRQRRDRSIHQAIK